MNKPQSILIVDDDQNILLTIKDILSSEGFPVRVARNGHEGLESVRHEQPDLILLDLWMPSMNGQEMAQRLGDAGVSIPILVMSAVQKGEHLASQMGAAGFIPKPFDIIRLLDEVERLLGNQSSDSSASLDK
ncbi:MAG: response regulator [Thermomicrobiaceae bacterium]